MAARSPADDLRQRATALRHAGFRLDRSELLVLGPSAGEDTWIGPTATAFRDDLTRACSELGWAHDALLRAVRRLEAQADELDRAARLAAPAGPR